MALALVSCTTPSLVSTGSAELAIPETMDFGRTALSFSRVKPLVVLNRTRVSTTVNVFVSAPFSAPSRLEVPAGAEASLEVTFSPNSDGAVSGALSVDGFEVALTGEGVAALDCGASTVCDSVRFDPETLSCVRTPKPDGSACEDELACIEGGICRAGICLGRAARCDDGNACTTDACTRGRGCQHLAFECAPVANPCQAPTCDPVVGCGSAPVQDGTPCGAISCELANVCLAGHCRAVVPPEGFVCSPESACRGEGVCRNKTCVRPPEHELSPRWTYTASGIDDFRFEGVTDAQGNWYWVECSNALTGKQPAYRCDVPSRTPEGLERFRTEVTGTGRVRGTKEKLQLIAQGLFIFGVNNATIAAVNSSTGVVVWQASVAPASPGAEVEALADDGRGGLWTIVRTDDETESWELVRVDVATGRVLLRRERPSRVRNLLTDGAGRAFVLRDLKNLIDPVDAWSLERIDPDGTIGFSVDADSPPIMVLGDRLVLADDSVRSTTDGTLLEETPHTDWSTSAWAGVSPGAASSRLRLAINTAPFTLPLVALQKLDASGIRVRPFTTVAHRATEAYLTATGEALFATSGAMNETRAHQVHPLGLELMSCTLVENVNPGSNQALRIGAKSGFNGRFFAVQSLSECVDCAFSFRSEHFRVAFYDFGRPGPGIARTGWTGPRGTPSGGGRPR
jgi:hypothetical protein